MSAASISRLLNQSLVIVARFNWRGRLPTDARAAVLVFAWAVAEATVWPIMPDAVLVPLTAFRPACWWRLALVAAAGSTVGGAMSYQLGRLGWGTTTVERRALVRPAMIVAVYQWLDREGARGVWHQPFSGVPFKIFAYVAGGLHLPVGPFLLQAGVARGIRLLAAAGLAALAGRSFSGALRRHRFAALALWSIAFGLGLRQTLHIWERRATAAVACSPSSRP
ncbi:MAG: hypothetical protein IT305_14125 [Chloroflexi bacterium]|nr:hypothetical protein [Chloroflexota bacterium]